MDITVLNNLYLHLLNYKLPNKCCMKSCFAAPFGRIVD